MRMQKIEDKLDTIQKILNYFGKYDIENRSTVERIIKAHDKELVERIKSRLRNTPLVSIEDYPVGWKEGYMSATHLIISILDPELNVKNENDERN